MNAHTLKKVALLAVCTAGLVSGCAARRVREEAKLALGCSSVKVREVKEYGSWLASGCGLEAVCTLPNVSGAEVQCAGGAPARRSISLRATR
jgi:hypothetical protein